MICALACSSWAWSSSIVREREQSRTSSRCTWPCLFSISRLKQRIVVRRPSFSRFSCSASMFACLGQGMGPRLAHAVLRHPYPYGSEGDAPPTLVWRSDDIQANVRGFRYWHILWAARLHCVPNRGSGVGMERSSRTWHLHLLHHRCLRRPRCTACWCGALVAVMAYLDVHDG